jgi:hypothetical protein
VRLQVAPGHFQPTPEDEARCVRDNGFDRRHLYALMAACAAWRAALLPVTTEQVDAAVEQARGLRWAGKCLGHLEKRGYVQRLAAKVGKNNGALQYTPTQRGLSLCPAPPAEGVAAE